MSDDGLDAADGVEALDQSGRTPAAQGKVEHDVEPEDVEQREDAEHHVVGPVGEPGVAHDLVEVREQVAVREHGRLGRAGRPRGEEQRGDVVRSAVDGNDGLGIEVVLQRVRALDSGALGREHVLEPGPRPVDTGERLAAAGPDHRDPSAGGRDLPLELGRRAGRVERHDRGPGPQRRQVRHHEEPVVGGHQGHPVAGLDPEADEPGP